MAKYHFVFETEKGIFFEYDTEDHPPRVGDWVDLMEFGPLGFFLIKRVTHRPNKERTHVFFEVEKHTSRPPLK